MLSLCFMLDHAVPALSELKAQTIAHFETYHLEDALASDELHQKNSKKSRAASAQHFQLELSVQWYSICCLRANPLSAILIARRRVSERQRALAQSSTGQRAVHDLAPCARRTT